MKRCLALLLIALSPITFAFGHPGGGIVALSENSAIVADSVENFLWLLERGQKPQRLVSQFHGHWLTRGRDGQVYAEAFQESGGAWSSAAFRLNPPDGRLTEVAHRDDLGGALTFAVDRDGSLVFQRGSSLVSRRDGRESSFRPNVDRPCLGNVTAYAWGSAGELFYADQNQIFRVDLSGTTTRVAVIEGKTLEPRIWNATDKPSVFGLTVDAAGSVLAAVPDLGRVYRWEKDGADNAPSEIAGSGDGWRATGVAVFGDSLFLMESDPRASTSPRVRILRSNGQSEVLSVGASK